MLRLGEAKREPQKIVLRAEIPPTADHEGEPEAYVVMVPITPPLRRRAQRLAQRTIGADEQLSDLELDRLIDIGEVASRELIRLCVAEWGGIGDADGKPLELTPDRETRFATAMHDDRPTGSIDLLLEDEDACAVIDEQFVRADALRRAEKNGLSALPSGIGKAETPAKDIASSAASRKPGAAARSARTGPKSRRPKAAKRPGSS